MKAQSERARQTGCCGRLRLAARLLGLVPALVLGTGIASAQSSDFWFEPPRGQVGIRLGMSFASADSDIYDFVTEQLTLEQGDFNAGTLGIDGSLNLHERFDLVLGFEYSRTTNTSEYRDFVGDDGLPIAQKTRLTVIPVTASIKIYVTPRGRQTGRLAWVPAKVAAYAGAGGGPAWHEFRQWGEFVDFADLSIFRGSFKSSGWTFMGHLFGGVELNPSKRLVLAFEARYALADAELGLDFVGFEPIDLSGLRVTGGVAVRF